MSRMSPGYAAWWDAPNTGGDDTPVIRHAPEDGNYHLPDWDMVSKMRGSQVGKFAVVPRARRDGTSTGFDASVAGPVHVDPDAPDGGVIFDPTSVDRRTMNQAVATNYYPHQVFYKLGTPAPLLGYGRGRFYGHEQQFVEPPRVNPHLGDHAYIVPKAAGDGGQRLTEIPTIVGNGMAPAPYNPQFHAQEEQRVNPAPPLSSLPPMVHQPVAGPAAQPAPMPAQPQYAPAAPVPPQPVHPGQYQHPGNPYQQPTQPYYPPPPPPADPALMGMMHQLLGGMTALQQRVVAVEQRAAAPPQQPGYPPTTGVSANPMPVGPPPGLATLPVGAGGRPRGGYNTQNENFDDETARPIRKQVIRDKRSQRIIEEDQQEEDDGQQQQPQRPVRRARPNSLVEHDQAERQQTERQYERYQEPGDDRVITGFESLELPFVTGPLGNKAKRRVFLEIPGAGKHSGHFHDIIESEHCVALVYDTRYEDGTQYLPPDMGDTQLKLHVPDKKITYTVSSMGFHYSFGVFDQIVLVKHGVEPLN